MKNLRLLALPLCLIALAAVAPTASALTRYASPSVGPGGSCAQEDPCTLTEAVNGASGSQFSVKVLPGTHGSATAPVVNLGQAARGDTTIEAADPAQRPLVYLSSSGPLHALILQAGSVSDIDFRIVDSPSMNYGVYALTLNRISVFGPARTAACFGDTISNSTCASTFEDGSGIEYSISSGAPFTKNIAFTNVTAWSGPVTGAGINLLTGANVNLVATIKNSIAHGSSKDIKLENSDSINSSINAVVSNSNFSTPGLTGSGLSITGNAASGNQSAEPVLADPTSGNFRQLSASPTIDSGSSADAVGTQDVFGLARIRGAAVDIGATEFAVLPVMTKLRLLKKRYKAAKSGAALQPAANALKKKNKGRGSVLSFNLSDAGNVNFRLFRQVKKNGKKSWSRQKGVETVAGVLSYNRFWFSGRWAGKALKPGTYQIKATPTVKGESLKNVTGDEPGTLKGPTSILIRR